MSTGVGILGNEVNYRGADLPLPKYFLIRPCDLILLICCCTEAIYHPSALSTVACWAAPSLASDAPIIHAPMGFEASQLQYSMAYNGMLIPVT